MADTSSSDDDEQQSLVQRAITTALVPVQVATSRPAIKTYLSIILFLSASFVLLSLSTAAYLFFYYNFIPQIDLCRVIYLQYGAGPYPHATVPLDTSALVSQQPYDIAIELHIPRTPGNLAAGNFMLDLSLLADSTGSHSPKVSSILPNSASILPYTTLTSSRRPTILPYSSPLPSLANTLIQLPWHILSFRDLDAHHLAIPMFEHLSFARGSPSQIPTAIRLELQSEHVLQIYSTKILFTAKFKGLRYIIYNYRILSFLLFSAVFYVVTVTSFAIAWLLITSLFSSAKAPEGVKKEPTKDTTERIKTEPADEKPQLSNGHVKAEPGGPGPAAKDKANPSLAAGVLLNSDSDTSSDHGLSLSNLSDGAATFPGIGRQMPLRMPARQGSTTSASAPGSTGRSSRVSMRGSSGGDAMEAAEVAALSEHPQVKTEDVADDEDEEEEGPLPLPLQQEEQEAGRGRDVDSGIGTSMESEYTAVGTAAGLSRRRSSWGLGGEKS